jgi:hypothetical protein
MSENYTCFVWLCALPSFHADKSFVVLISAHFFVQIVKAVGIAFDIGEGSDQEIDCGIPGSIHPQGFVYLRQNR